MSVVLFSRGIVTAPPGVVSGGGGGGGGSGFARKPVIPTPSLPTPLRTLYVTAGAAGGGDGSIGAPFNTIQAAEAVSIPGDLFIMSGDFVDTSGAYYFGIYGRDGNSTNPIVWKAATVGGASFLFAGDVVTHNVGLVVPQYTWIHGLRVETGVAPDNGDGVRFAGSDSKMIACTFHSSSVIIRGTTKLRNELWDCEWTGSIGSIPANTGEALYLYDGASYTRVMRCNFDGMFYHVTIGVYDSSGGGANILTDNEFFDCRVRNPAAGGLMLLGACERAHVHWCELYDMHTSASVAFPPGSSEPMEIACKDSVIEFNWFHNNDVSGVSFQGLMFFGTPEYSSGNIFRNNVISYNGGMPIHVSSFSAGTPLIDQRNAWTNNVIENNIFAYNHRTVYPTPSGDDNVNQSHGYLFSKYWNCVLFLSDPRGVGTAWVDNNVYGNVIRNNITVNETTTDTNFVLLSRYPEDGGFLQYTEATWASASGGSNNTKTTTSQMTSTSDPHLLTGVAAIDAGIASGPYLSGLGAALSYLDSGVDIGIYEYGGDD